MTNDNIEDNSASEQQGNNEIEIIYKKEFNPLLKIILVVTSISLVSFIAFFGIGFFMGLSGVRPPTIDTENILKNMSDKAFDKEPVQNKLPDNIIPEDYEKYNKVGASYEAGKESGKLFIKNKSHLNDFWTGFHSVSNNISGKEKFMVHFENKDTFNDGKEIGKKFNENKNAPKDFWGGFNEVTNEKSKAN